MIHNADIINNNEILLNMKQVIFFEIEDNDLALKLHDYFKKSDDFSFVENEDSGFFLKKKTKSILIDVGKVALPSLIAGIFSLIVASSGDKKEEQQKPSIVIVIETDKNSYRIASPTDKVPAELKDVSKIKIIKSE